MSTTTPLRMPVEGAIPTPRISIWSSAAISLTMAQTLVVPISRATTSSLFDTEGMSFEPMTADDGEIEENAAPERDHGGQVEIADADRLPHVDERYRDHRVAEKAREEDIALEPALDAGADAAEDGVEAREHRQGEVLRPVERHAVLSEDVSPR